MNSNSKRQAALELLATTGIWRGNHAPPFLRLLWWLGFDVPPPHFASFQRNFTESAVFFSLITWLSFWSWQNMPIALSMTVASAGGLFFGLFMASYYEEGKRKHKLPSWSELNTAAAW